MRQLVETGWLIVFAASALGCAPTLATQATAPPTATTVRIVQASPFPTGAAPTERPMQSVGSPIPLTATPTPEICAEAAIPLHTVTAEVDYAAHRVEVEQRTRYVNLTGEALSEIVFSVEPNRYPGIFSLSSVTANDNGISVTATELTGRRLSVELSRPLARGCALELDLRFQLQITPVGQVLSANSGYLGYTARQFNLALWLPALAPYRVRQWITHDSAPVGEQTIFELADWDVDLRVTNAPDDLILAAPGIVAQIDAERWRIRHDAARDLALSLSSAYLVERVTTENGVTVEAYTFSDALVNRDNARVNGGAHMLDVAAKAIAMYSDLFGAYPYDRFVIIQADFRDGMEFSGLAYVGGEWFRTFPGTPASYLTIITVHEAAHQWWYARIGSDQALTPWLDEALATYSEYIFYEEFYPDLKDWWWSFRVDSFLNAENSFPPVDSPVFAFSSSRAYINAVYLRGARMFHQLRADLGTDAFFDWLRRYADAGDGQIADAETLWSLLSPLQLEATAATRSRYLLVE
jgi:P2-related tail formation protein